MGSLLTFGLIALLAVRWRIFLKKQHLNLPLATLVPLTWSGQFFNSILPGSTGGDLIKILQLCRFYPDRKAEGAVTVVMDRFTALIALVALAGCALLIQPISLADVLGNGSFQLPWWLLFALACITTVACAVVITFCRKPVWQSRFTRLLAVVKASLRPSPSLAAALFLSFVIHCISFAIAYCFAQSLHLTVTVTKIFMFMPVLVFLVMMPVTVNGHGLREVLLIFYFNKLGIAAPAALGSGVKEAAVALSALIVMNDLLWSLPGGLWYLLLFKNTEKLRESIA